MSDVPIIRAQDVRKVYRLYAKPYYRLLDLFGLLPAGGGRYSEHPALDGVSLDVGAGEKVAIIGRNGAGKSTLLKLITRVIEPTSGSVSVRGQIHALLQIGTGFHPDFTGRQNVFAYLAQLGVTGTAAERACAEIVEFAELEEYIDQPLKTYSTGMAVRLMFSTATAISPDVLVLDEILGVGDAYFARKSYERIRTLAERHGTTLLLVTHDLYSAVQVCERVIWIDHGRVIMDGDGPLVIKSYEDSIRAQEERRLRQRRLHGLQAAENAAAVVPLVVELQAPQNVPLAAPVYFARLELLSGGHLAGTVHVGDLAADAGAVVPGESVWGDVTEWRGVRARPMLNYGAPYHKVSAAFRVPAALLEKPLRLRAEVSADESVRLSVRAYGTEGYADLGSLGVAGGNWERAESGEGSFVAASAAALAEINPSGVHGTARLTIDEVRVLDGEGCERYQLAHGDAASFDLYYTIRDPSFHPRAQVLVAFQRDGVTDVCRFIARDLVFDVTAQPHGRVRLHIARLALAPGSYAVSVMVAEQGYYDREQVLFYSINPAVFCCLSRVCEIVVSGGGAVAAGTGVVGEGEWQLLPL